MWVTLYNVCIRIKNNIITTNDRTIRVNIDALFYGLKPEQQIVGSKKFI